jgi:hypothetical protein
MAGLVFDGVLEILFSNVAVSVYLDQKRTITLLHRLSGIVSIRQIRPLHDGRWQTVLEKGPVEFLILVLQEFGPALPFLGHGKANAPDDYNQSQKRNGDVDTQAHVVIVCSRSVCGNGQSSADEIVLSIVTLGELGLYHYVLPTLESAVGLLRLPKRQKISSEESQAD